MPVPMNYGNMAKAGEATVGSLMPRIPGKQALKPAVGKLNLDRGLSPTRALNMVGNTNNTKDANV